MTPTATKEPRSPEAELARIVDALWTVHEAIRGHLQLEDREEPPFWWGALDHAIEHASECSPIPKGFHGPRRVDTVVGEVDLEAMADVLNVATRHLGEALSEERRTLGRLQQDLRGWVERMEAPAADPQPGDAGGGGGVMSRLARDLERLSELHPDEGPHRHVDTALIPLKSRLELVENLLRGAIGGCVGDRELTEAELQAMADNVRDVREGIGEAVRHLYRENGAGGE